MPPSPAGLVSSFTLAPVESVMAFMFAPPRPMMSPERRPSTSSRNAHHGMFDGRSVVGFRGVAISCVQE